MNDPLLNGGLEGAIALHQMLQYAVAAVVLLWSAVVAVYAFRQPPGWDKWIAWSIALSLAALVCSLTWFPQVAPAIGISEHSIGIVQAAALSFVMLSGVASVARTLFRSIEFERRPSE